MQAFLNDGTPVYYDCAAANDFLPDPAQVEALVTPRTRALVIINPNNPTGAAYPRELLEKLVAVAVRHDLLLLADEIYDGITYDDAAFQPLAPHRRRHRESAARPVQVHRHADGAWAGCCSGAMPPESRLPPRARPLGAMKLCANVPASSRRGRAPGGHDLGAHRDGGVYESRRAIIEYCAASDHLRVVATQGRCRPSRSVDRRERFTTPVRTRAAGPRA